MPKMPPRSQGLSLAWEKFNSNRGNSNHTHKNARELPFLRNIIAAGISKLFPTDFFQTFSCKALPLEESSAT